MLTKSIVIAFFICIGFSFANAQENKLLQTFNNKTTNIIMKGDYVRISYPSAKLAIKKPGKATVLIGFRGKVDSVGVDNIWLRIEKRTGRKQAFAINDIVAIKEVSKSSELLTFIGSSIVIGSAAVGAGLAADINPAATAFAGAFSLFPAAILTANVFYPTKPRRKVGESYTLKVITIN